MTIDEARYLCDDCFRLGGDASYEGPHDWLLFDSTRPPRKVGGFTREHYICTSPACGQRWTRTRDQNGTAVSWSVSLDG